MFQCPGCGHRQVRVQLQRKVFWTCQRCGGRLAGISLLRELGERSVVERYWKLARRRKPQSGPLRRCAACGWEMHPVHVADDSSLPTLDACRHCQVFWFDPGEFELVPRAPVAQVHEPGLRELVAQTRESDRRELDERTRPQEAEPNWQFLFLFLGLPMEQLATRVQRRPWVTWGLAAALSLIWLLTFTGEADLYRAWGFIPAQPLRKHGATLLTSFLLHGGPAHLVCNVYYLVCFSDNVEDFLGHWRFTLLLLASHLAGVGLKLIAAGDPTLPSIGASAGISGVIVYYALRFPRARILVLVYVWPFRASASRMLLVWVGLQLLVLFFELRGESPVSASAHFGGALVGLAVWLVQEGARWLRGLRPALAFHPRGRR